MQAFEDEIKRMIIDVLHSRTSLQADIDAEAPLFVEGLGLDSIDALELGVAIHSATALHCRRARRKSSPFQLGARARHHD